MEVKDVSVTWQGVQVVYSTPWSPLYGRLPEGCKWYCDVVNQTERIRPPQCAGMRIVRIDVGGYEAQVSYG